MQIHLKESRSFNFDYTNLTVLKLQFQIYVIFIASPVQYTDFQDEGFMFFFFVLHDGKCW